MTTLAQSSLRSARAIIGSLAVFACLASLRADAVSTATPATVSAGARSEAIASPAPFSREQLLAALTRAVGAHFNLEGDLQLELLRAWTPPAKLASAWELNVQEFPALPAASMMFRCQLMGDGATVLDTTFVVRAQLWRDSWSTRQPLVVGTPFDSTQLEARRVDVMRERDALPASVGDRNYIFARAVPAGRMLTWRDIARRPLVKKGDLVEVAAVDGPLVVTMKGMAMENGAKGETVTVRNPESRKDFAALVVSENRVQVRF
jgi:flagella basal body P-ring formation protein FlgA